MKKLLLFFVIMAFSATTFAQNFQTHYDFGKNRKYLTTTFEMFKPDKHGSTFIFVDFDYGIEGHEGVSLSYMEIARTLKFWQGPFSAHIEYNGGFGKVYNFDSYYTINNAFLAGIDYSWNASDYSKGFSLKALYKNIHGADYGSFQLTAVWYLHLLNNKVTFSGFADFWKEESDFNFDNEKDADFIFISEPQIWYNVNKNFAIGSELELSYNFGLNDGFMFNPTLGAKYTF